ncbi:hypothetical protein B0H14DRAFT_3755689 [Mycena olivaceomarginata]|nr:hypothetical protein B0H14DRAFT_3755689 [Mycena olivaceomarginata]
MFIPNTSIFAVSILMALTAQISAQATRARRATVAQLAAKQTSKKTVFETCANDDECQQGCCGFKTGKCAGPDVAQTNGSGGCGRSEPKPNCNVATLLGFKNCIAGAKNNNLKDAPIQQSAAFAAQLDGLHFTPSKRENGIKNREIVRRATIAQLAAKQKSKKTVFEACANDDECRQGCCGFKTGKCAGPDVAQTNGSGGSIQQSAAFAAQLDNLPFKPSRRDIVREPVEA